MIVTLAQAKKYLRVDYSDDNALIKSLITAAEKMCQDVLRTDSMDYFTGDENVRVAVMYAVAYLYEHREKADHKELMLTLRAMLGGIREETF